MAIAPMKKVMIVSHRSQATELLQTLQDAGIVQILDAERAMVSKEWPELMVEIRRHRDLEESIGRLQKAIEFLSPYAAKDPISLFSPRIEIDARMYEDVVSTEGRLSLLDEVEAVSGRLEKLAAEMESRQSLLNKLLPWKELTVSIEELGSLTTSTTFVGLIPDQHYATALEKLAEEGAVVEKTGSHQRSEAVIVVCLKESAGDVHKVLRSVEFEPAAFEGLTGTIRENIGHIQARLKEIAAERAELNQKAFELAKSKLKFQILFDHTRNLLSRTETREASPATDYTVFFEGWVRKADYRRLEDIVKTFDAAAVAEVEPGEGEEPPVEINNGPMAQPFESVTRLYGMPAATDVDPTAFLAPFFALFFGICLTDAAYGLVMLGFLWWLLRKIKGDRKFVMMLIFCSIVTVIAGALTGGWCGDMIQSFTFFNGGTKDVIDTPFEVFRDKLMWFDPLEKPMYFFNISLGLGYLQIICGVFIGFWHRFRRGEITEALFDHLSWFVWLNSLAVFGLARAGVLPSWIGTVAGGIAVAPALAIVLFSERQGGWGARIGMGIYNLFSTVFYVGDVLSYIRLMALGMVTAGFGMAINEIVRRVMEGGVLGWILGAVIFVGGHVFNIANSALGSFVHSMRLQFVEFFTKFLQGGGRQFDPLKENYRYVDVKKENR